MTVASRASETRQKLITAAVDLFVDKGYLETTPRDIASKARLTTGAFYYHFTSKEEIGVAVAEESWPEIAAVLKTHLDGPERGLESVTRAAFAGAEKIVGDRRHWISFFLDHAIGHLSPSARRTHRERVTAFTEAVPAALRDEELREGMSRSDAGQLLSVALIGSLLMSGALDEKGPAVIDRLTMAWTSAVRSIVPPEELPRFERLVTAIAEHHKGV